MPDTKELLETEYDAAVEAARARIREEVERATREVLAEHDIMADLGRAPQEDAQRMTRSDAARLFGVPMSRLRSFESRGLVHPRRRGGRIMVDPQEVADALGVPMPETKKK